ncbi:MAG TPA: glycosyltransferase family 4 protein, partial [bacterium]
LTNVEFTGSLKGRALQQGVLGAQFVVVPSEWYENSPLVIYEAFTMGKPVIGSRIGGIPELVGEGQDGLLFNPGDATELHECIQTLLRRPRSSIRMGKRARQKAVAWFDPEKHYHEIMGIYQSLRR